MKPVYAKTQDTRLAGIERKIRFLERREQLPSPHLEDDLDGGGGGGSGIQYDTDNEGNYLDIGTTGTVPGSGGGGYPWGTRFHADTTGTGYSNKTVGIDAGGDGDLTVGLRVIADNSKEEGGQATGIDVTATGNMALAITASSDSFYGIQVTGYGGIYVNTTYGPLYLVTPAGPTLRVDADGTVHMKYAPVIDL